MSVVVASPPTSGWQALASTFPSDSATLILRLVLFFIVITIAGSGLRLIMRNSSSVSAPASARIPATTASDGTGEHPQEGIEMNNFNSTGNPILSATTNGGPSVTCDVLSTSSAANTVLLDVAAMALSAS